MVLVLGIGVLVIGMGVLAHTLFTSAVNTSSRHLTYEQAIHVAEQGIDQTLARLKANTAYNTGVVLPAFATTADEQAWVRQEVANAPAAAVQQAPGGEVLAIKPLNRNVIYSASWIPSRAAAARTRIVKAEYLPFSTFSPDHAILTAGALEIGGNSAVNGIGGSVHANGDVEIWGSAEISGDLSTSGVFTSEGGEVHGDRLAMVPTEDIPEIDPRAVWNQHAQSGVYDGNWYDLCPDGRVRLPDGSAPCAGTEVANTSSGTEFRGWKLSGDTWGVGGNVDYDGVYYVYQGNISLTGNPGSTASPWLATLIAEAAPAGAGAGSCTNLAKGDIDIRGTPVITGFLEGLLVMAGRDLEVNGNTQQAYEGVMAAHEQVDASGNATLNGAIINGEDCDTPGSPVTANRVSGSMMLTHHADLEIPVGGDVRTTLWLEL